MTKEDWLSIRSQEEIPIEVFHTYYLEKGGYVKDLREFTIIFARCITHINMISLDKVVNFTYETAIHTLFKYYDGKFKI